MFAAWPQHRINILLYLTITLMIVSLGGLLFISGQFEYSIPWSMRPTYMAVALMVMAGMGYFVFINGLLSQKLPRYGFYILILLGALFRVMWFSSEPIYEDDSYRYFFDGALTNQGLNPYQYAPADALPSVLETGNPSQINIEGPVDRVAYPYIRTIYPPLAQAFFALHTALSPWDLDVWRLMLLIIDFVSLWLLIKMLKISNRSPLYSLIFWLNPLIITETMNAGHMDALLLPFLIGTTILALKNKHSLAGIALALAVGIKIWPVILAPLLFAKFLKQPKKLLLTALPFILISGLLLSPQIFSKLNETAGLVAFSESWQVNAFLFSMIESLLSLMSDQSALLARVVIILIIGALIIWQMKQQSTITKGMLIITVALFLLSPTGYPWYFIWLMPWLVLHPSPALLLLTVTLPLYDLRYPLSLNEDSQLFDMFVVPITFFPTLAWLAFDKRWLKPKEVQYA